jgi:hypothetical protein
MSLLDSGPHVITVYPAGPVKADGTRGPAGSPVSVRCLLQPSTSDPDSADGYATDTTVRVIGRALPAGPWDRVSWDGADWTVVGQPEKWSASPRVAHTTALIRRR